MGNKWYVAVSANGKDTILGSARSINKLARDIGFDSNVISYYLHNKKVCKKLNARFICYEG